ncbi:hypothetical protein GH714_015444 [Hevea brasiliensis]|uniref:Leucine-rich repeat-containing N-terminal plant-type domain-containing protein n=1 Tax=Hevea brasiliensis TaxID=3981 RepID=A0A6A6LM85_HEVBR|nr:hypothetical protein GH714_015444 [Hevea brasiliensis]
MLGLAGNRIFGRIPDSLGNLQKLNKIDLSGNELLNGSIPKEVLNLPSLTTIFNLSNNFLSGNLPQEIGSLESIVAIDLSNNRLSGNIPNMIKNCKSLEELYIARNTFSGPIPGTLGEVKGLGTLDLSYNNLSGFIPPDLQKLQALESLNLAFNNLEGIVPCGGVFTNLSRVQLEGNPKLSLKIGCGNAQDHRRKPVKVYVSVGVAVMATLVVFFSIVGWVQSAFPSRLLQVLDPELLLLMHNLFHDGRNINPEVQQECVITILGIGLSCTMNSPDSRISIRNALHKLKAARNNLLNHVPTHQASKCVFPLLESAALSIETDKQALISFKSQISLESSNSLSSWVQSSSPCNWTGVSCNRFGQRVVGLKLSRLGLVGSISPYIGNLSFLQSLELQNNQLTGTLPEEICNLSGLRVLNLSSNSLQGSIPSNVSKLTELRILDVSMN